MIEFNKTLSFREQHQCHVSQHEPKNRAATAYANCTETPRTPSSLIFFPPCAIVLCRLPSQISPVTTRLEPRLEHLSMRLPTLPVLEVDSTPHLTHTHFLFVVVWHVMSTRRPPLTIAATCILQRVSQDLIVVLTLGSPFPA